MDSFVSWPARRPIEAEIELDEEHLMPEPTRLPQSKLPIERLNRVLDAYSGDLDSRFQRDGG